jgi:hypothetical protein
MEDTPMRWVKVEAAKREYALYTPDKPSVWELRLDSGEVLGHTHAYHIHGPSWGWDLVAPGGERIASAGNLRALRRIVSGWVVSRA